MRIGKVDLTSKRAAVLVVLAAIVILSGIAYQFWPRSNENFCGDGYVIRWNQPRQHSRAYIVMTETSTEYTALAGHVIRSLEMTPDGVLVGFANELEDNLQFLTPGTEEVCGSGDLHIVGHINRVRFVKQGHEIFVATDKRSIYRFSNGRWQHYGKDSGLTDDRFYDVGQSPDGRWFASAWEKTFELGANNKWISAKQFVDTPFPQNNHTFLFAAQDDLWVGTIGAGLFRKKGGQWMGYLTQKVVGWDNVTVVPQLKTEKIRRIALSPKGEIWIGGDPGLTVYNPVSGRWSTVLSQQQILDIQFDNEGKAWATGKDGTFVISDSVVKRYWKGGLAIALGRKGWVWGENIVVIGTENGLYIGDADKSPLEEF